MKIQQMKNGQHFITLPRQIVRAKNWKKGQELEIIINDQGQLIIKEVDKNSKNK
jgi:bifunctional DNA-binding transcriptional regulator/antitoxin component of YhaV-PrlF toxin-antitoxin module